jgi:D-threo-aldose 1-dehydrogenase
MRSACGGRLVLSELGLGAAPLGNLYRAIDDQSADATLEAAISGGASYIDTAPHYGHGLSERRVGAFLQRTGARPALSTKLGRTLKPANGAPDNNGFVDPDPFNPVFEFSEAAINAQFASSLARLGVDRVDALFLHDIGRVVQGDAHEAVLEQALTQSLPAMDALKADGQTGAIGLGVNEVEVCEEVLARRPLDVCLLAGRYTLLEQARSLGFMNDCAEAGIAIVIGGAFNSGVLVQRDPARARYNYTPAPQPVLDRAQALADVCSRYDTPLPAAALQFCLAHPAVVSVAAGAQSAGQVREILDFHAHPIPAELWVEMKSEGLIHPDAPVPA